jgi:hypothetical protein
MALFRIYYDDGTTFEGKDEADAINAPACGVQIIAMENPAKSKGFGVLKSRDMYIWKQDRFWACDESGFWDYMFHQQGNRIVLFGRTVDDDNYNKIAARAINEGFHVQ